MGDILFLAHRVPFPPDRGDKIRAYNALKYIAARSHVHLVAFADDPRDLESPELGALTASHAIIPRTKSKARAAVEALATGRSVSVAAFADPAFQSAVERILASEPIDAIYVFSSAIAQYLPSTRPRTVMDFCDVNIAKFDEYGREASGAKAWLFAREARKLRDFDLAVARDADASLFVSTAEAQLFRSIGGEGAIHVVENGIDTVKFDPDAQFETVDAAGPLIVFTGQMDYAPNVAAVTWFATDILPLIRAHYPTARFAIVGRAPTAEVLALVNPAVIVTGEVADVRGWLAAADVVVAPLEIARGIQNKVLEAMAMARPLVASAAAAEGIDHAGTLRTATGAEDFAGDVCAVFGDPSAAAKLGAAARAQVQTRYGWGARLAALDGLLDLQPIPVRAGLVEAHDLSGGPCDTHFDKLSANGKGGGR